MSKDLVVVSLVDIYRERMNALAQPPQAKPSERPQADDLPGKEPVRPDRFQRGTITLWRSHGER